MDFSSFIHWLVLGLYAAATVCILAGTLHGRSSIKSLGAWLTAGGFVLHALHLVLLVVVGKAINAPFFFSLFSWSLLLVFALLWRKLRIGFLGMAATPLALLIYTASFAFTNLKVEVPKEYATAFWGLHIGSLYISMGLLAMAFGAGLAFIYMDSSIKRKQKMNGIRKEMPSLSTFDAVNRATAMIGFPLYTLGLFSGFVWSGLTRGMVFTGHPREVAALLSWLFFAFFFHQRLAQGLQGRRPARLAIWLFIFTMASMLAINLLWPTHHSLVQTQS
ncbi:cytochrome c biogenesis protein CcsA [Desulfohalovibrio reitneri]|jgi:ABC-type transport system involved in cytochrome c biogenesis permease subunit|uniref:cytochrome c biogenesis protein CcsA n=1 Tax=Desulfohalovibrio reitneri TaxID=1307759 RepID=UPI0004A7078F|nr:cytochrome c biogenesis protein CcsA [Desulfohalovibrio reitneri]